MFSDRLLDTAPLIVLFLGTVALLFGASEIGFRIGAWTAARRGEGDKTPTNAIMGSTLGLLAFMLAFTFGMSNTRFDTRRQLVLDEAGAILKTYQRAQFLPAEQRDECMRLLQEYVALRVAVPQMETTAEIRDAVVRSQEIQDGMWAQAASLAASPNTVLTAFMNSLADLSDLQMKRVRAAVWNRLPTMIVVMLYSIAFLGLMAIGYGAGLVASRTLIPTVVVAVAFSSIMVLIIDLERPNQTLFHVSHEPMSAVAVRMGVAPGPSDR
jgi:hypothetical protein